MPFLDSIAKVFKPASLVGDIRSAIVGSICGVLASFFATWLFANSVREFAVLVNENGYAQPSSLFEYVEQQEPKLKLSFKPKEFRNVFVCEYKLVTGNNWRQLAFKYFDSYRDCFDVTARSENEFIVSPNLRSSLLKVANSTYLCKCNQ